MGLLNYVDRHYQHMKRYNQILGVLAKYGFEDLVAYMEETKRTPFLKKLLPKKTLEHSLHLTKWEKMRLVCEELGPTFVKFGQILSNRPDLLPEALIAELEKLQDSVPPLPGKVSVSVVEQQLGKKIEELFASFEPEAFASASMAQVHKAILKTGEKVVVKVQRPGIKEMIAEDIKIMYSIAAILNKRVPSVKSFDPIGLVKNFETSITRELDFIHESVNVQRFKNNFLTGKGNEGVVYTPEVFREFTTEKVLTLEYIDGIKISDTAKLESNGYDRKLIARRLVESYFKQVFHHGFFHADPHPGNLFVLKDNVVCYIDYGMMGSIMKKDLEQIGYLFLSVRSRDVRKIIRSLQQLSDNPVIHNFRDLEADLDEFVNNYVIREFHSHEMSTFLLELKDIIVKHNLKVPSHFFLLARSLVSVEGVVQQLDPGLDMSKAAHPFMIRMVARQYNPVKFAKRIFNSVYEMGMYMEDFPRDIKNAIRKINTGEIKVDLRHTGIDPLIHTMYRASKQIISAVILSSLIIGSSLVIVADVPPYWDGTSIPGILGIIIAGIMAIGLIRDIRKGDHDKEF